MSPEQKQLPKAKIDETEIGEIEISAEVAKGLRAHYESTTADSKEVLEIPKSNLIAECSSRNEGVYQDLRALVKAGDDYFAIISVFANRSVDNPIPLSETVIARHRPGERAELIGVIGKNEDPMKIGRSHQKGFGLGPTVSREHFAVAQSDDGKMGIIDMGSSNRTEVFLTKKELPSTTSVDPLNDIDFWSVKSADLKSSLQEHLA